MTSTYTTYQSYSQDLARTLKRTAAEPQVARDAQYYKDNIGKISSVDDLLKNDRLYNYAMRAAGLTDMIKSKAFMKKVLTSDLNVATSFARKLTDTRYAAFARTFNFGTDGKITTSEALVQTTAQENDTVGLYTDHRVRAGQAAAAEAANYEAGIATLTSVDDLLANEKLLNFALKANGINPNYYATKTIRDALTSNLDEPTSVANTLGPAFKALAKSFSFNADGSINGTSAQPKSQLDDTIVKYYDATGNGATPKAAALKADLYRNLIGSVTTVDDLVNDPKLLNVAVAAFGLDPAAQSPGFWKQLLTSDVADPRSVAGTLGGNYQKMAEAFNFAPDGTIKGTDGAQSADKLATTVNGYMAHYADNAQQAEASETDYFKSRIEATAAAASSGTPVKKVDDILSDRRLYAYVLEAYDIDPDTASRGTIEQVLKSNPADPNSVANKLGAGYAKLAAAVNFDASGNVTTPFKAQSSADELRTVQLYNATIPATATDAEKAQAKAESAYYDQKISTAKTVDDIVGDTRVKAYLLKAYGLDKVTVTDASLKQILTSDPQDANSAAAKFNDTRYRDLAGAFNFSADGKIKRAPSAQVQSVNNTMKTADQYLQQQLESEAGAASDGVRLALYFRRKASNINSVFDVLADRALIEVVRTSLSLPTSFSQLDIEKQATYIKSKINIADFKDPAKLEKFISKFSALYDIQNSSSSSGSPATLLLGGASSAGISDTLLQSLQRLRLSR